MGDQVSIPGLDDNFSEENYENERDNNNDRDKTTVNENDQVSIPGLNDNFSEENYENERDNNNDREKNTISQTTKCTKDCADNDLRDVIAMGNSEDGVKNAENCAKDDVTNAATYIQSAENTIIPMSICLGDKDILSQMIGIVGIEANGQASIPGLNDDFPLVEEEIVEGREKEKISQVYEERPEKCDLKCSSDDRINVMIASINDEGYNFAKKCFTNDESSSLEVDMANGPPIIAGTICHDSWDIIKNHHGVDSIDIDNNVNILNRL